jgi:hypothetical protein
MDEVLGERPEEVFGRGVLVARVDALAKDMKSPSVEKLLTEVGLTTFGVPS